MKLKEAWGVASEWRVRDMWELLYYSKGPPKKTTWLHQLASLNPCLLPSQGWHIHKLVTVVEMKVILSEIHLEKMILLPCHQISYDQFTETLSWSPKKHSSTTGHMAAVVTLCSSYPERQQLTGTRTDLYSRCMFAFCVHKAPDDATFPVFLNVLHRTCCP